MLNKIKSSLELARLHHQRGQVREAAKMALELVSEVPTTDTLNWLTAARLAFQSYHELLKLNEIEFLYELVTTLVCTSKDEFILGRANHIKGMWLLSKTDIVLAKHCFETALEQSTNAQDFEGVARALHALVFSATLEKEFTQAKNLLIKTLRLTEQLNLQEITVSCLILKAYINFEENEYEESLNITWKAYELAKKSSFHYLEANILVQLARIHQRQSKSQLADIYCALAITGLDENEFPRLHQSIKIAFPKMHTESEDIDLIVNDEFRKLKERHKGMIDFKNQYILFDLVKLFSSNPGQRFSKAELIELIWKYEYNPVVHNNLIHVSIKRLRDLIEPNPENAHYILRDRKGYFMPFSITIKQEARSL